MKLLKNLASIVLAASSVVGVRADQIIYDDFSTGKLDPQKWNVQVDPEGKFLMDEYGVEDGYFRTEQKSPADRRVYLVPRHIFRSGDSLEYDVNVVSREGTYGNIAIVTGDHYERTSIVGRDVEGEPQLFDELGLTHVKLTFSPYALSLESDSPSGIPYHWHLILEQENGRYNLYIGSFTGKNGTARLDYDNFILSTPGKFVRGDVNADNSIDISDAVDGLFHLYASKPIDCQDAADVNDDGVIDLSDSISLLDYLFKDGNPIPSPMTIGKDETPDNLNCMR